MYITGKIKLTGPEDNFTISNEDDSLYLRGRTGEHNDVVAKKKIRVSD